MRKILLVCLMTLGSMSSAQISYNYGWEPTGDGSWTTSGDGSFARSATTPCVGVGSMRANNYYNLSSYLVSPVLMGNNGGDLTVNFSYKVTEYSSNSTGASLADFGYIKLEWAPSATGPWTTAYTIDNSSHVVSATCVSKSAVIAGLPASGDVFIRFDAKSGLGTSDNYVYFDDVSISQGAPPACVAPGGISVSSITSATASVSWTVSSSNPSGGYDIYYTTTNTAPTSGTTPTASVGAGVTTYPMTGLTANTNYYVWVRSNCGSGSTSAWTASLNVYTGYCTPAPSSVDGSGITNVTFGNSPNVVNNTTVAEAGNYGNYSTMIGDVPAGVASQVSITYATGYTYDTKIWVDLNNNLVFEDAEALYTGTSTNTNPTTLAASITIPASTPLGNYRMRIGGQDAGPVTSCYNGTYGAFEDYTVNVTVAPSCLPPSGLASSAVTATAATLSWTAPATAPANGYEYAYSTTNTAPSSGTATTATSVSLTPLAPATTYYYWVRSVCSGSSTSTWVTGSITTLATPPANDDCSGAIALTPGAAFAQNALTGTTLGSTNATSLAASCLFTTTNVGGNVWYSVVVPASGNLTIETGSVAGSPLLDTVMSVFADCTSTTSLFCDDDGGVDAFSKVVMTGQTPGATLLVSVWRFGSTATTTDGQFQISAYDASLSTSETTHVKNNLTVYPNPFADVLNISDVKNVKSISIVDIAGRVVKTIEKPSSSLQLRELNPGMYMFILNMNDGSRQTIKAIKK